MYIQIEHGVRYSCNQCEYSATRENNLKKHMHSMHEGVRYHCYQCELSASRPEYLEKHIQNNH